MRNQTKSLPPTSTLIGNVEFKTDTGCMIWLRGVSGGRPVSKVGGRKVLSYRHFYEQANGPLPKGTALWLKCGNRLCVNPDHYDAITQADRMRTIWRPGNGVKPRKSERMAMAIRRHAKITRFTRKQLARLYGVHYLTLLAIIERRGAYGGNSPNKSRGRGSRPKQPVEQADIIRADAATAKLTQKQLAAAYGISIPTLRAIVKRTGAYSTKLHKTP